MSQIFRRYRDVDIVSTTNPGSTLADVVENIQTNYSTAEKAYQGLSGVVDGVNTVFTLAETPDEGTARVYMGGVLLAPGVTEDYEISGATITFNVAPAERSVLWVNYRVTTSI